MHQVLLLQADAADVIYETQDGPDLMPATIELAGAEAALSARPEPEHALRAVLERCSTTTTGSCSTACPRWAC